MPPENPTSSAAASGGITRRQLLLAATAGGAALAAGALGGAALTDATARATAFAEAQVEVLKLRALLALYENLERVGLDAIVATGIRIVRAALETVRAGVRLLRDGITTAEAAIKNFQTMLDGLRDAADGVTRLVNDLGQKFRTAETFVLVVLGTARPLAESIAAFFNALIAKIPFGIGEEISRALNALVEMIRAIPTTVDAVLNQLLKPLREAFFPTSGDPAYKANLLDPLTKNVFEPLKKFLTDVEKLLDSWEKDFVKPAQDALDERAKIRKQIAEFRQQYNV